MAGCAGRRGRTAGPSAYKSAPGSVAQLGCAALIWLAFAVPFAAWMGGNIPTYYQLWSRGVLTGGTITGLEPREAFSPPGVPGSEMAPSCAASPPRPQLPGTPTAAAPAGGTMLPPSAAARQTDC